MHIFFTCGIVLSRSRVCEGILNNTDGFQIGVLEEAVKFGNGCNGICN